MSNSSTPVIRPRGRGSPSGMPSISANNQGLESNQDSYAEQVQSQFQFSPNQFFCQAHCCEPGCQNRSGWRPANDLSFRIDELEDDPVLCAGCVLRYPNLPNEQCLPIWPPNTNIMEQMYRIACRESRAQGYRILPPEITEKDEIISPRSPFARPLWTPPIYDENNRRIYVCPQCCRDFRKQSRYVRHVSEHINLFECRHCNQAKARVEDTKNHLIRTCLPRHYPQVSPSRFDGDENDFYHYSKHYRWRTNSEFLEESKRRFPNHNLGPEPAIESIVTSSPIQQNHYLGTQYTYDYAGN